MGEQIKLARLRRNLSVELVAERADISRATLWKVEKGDKTVAVGIFADSSPDRWGRVLMQRRERIYADKEGRKPRKLTDGDYLLGVYDETRMGAIRFKEDENGPFLSDDKETAAPSWATLRTLEEASRNFENEENMLNEKWLNKLLKPGSSLGGARPKATIQDTNGELWIAKFPSKNDECNTGAWEKVAHDLAKLCSLNVPESKLETIYVVRTVSVSKQCRVLIGFLDIL